MKTVDLPDAEACFERLRTARFGDTITCVYCGSETIEKKGKTEKGAQQYQCQTCKSQFTDLTRTVFEEREFGLEEMFYIIREMDNKPIAEIQRDLGRSHYGPVIRFVHHVRAVHPDHSELPLRSLCTEEELYTDE